MPCKYTKEANNSSYAYFNVHFNDVYEYVRLFAKKVFFYILLLFNQQNQIYTLFRKIAVILTFAKFTYNKYSYRLLNVYVQALSLLYIG